MQQRSEETRRLILLTAQQLFAQAGYDGTGVAEICAAAGVSKGAFYHHFPTKQAVFMALLEDWLAGLEEQLQYARHEAVDVPDGLVQMAGLTEGLFKAAESQFPIFLEFWIQSHRQDGVWKATIAPYRHYQEMLAGIIQEGIHEGSLTGDVEPEAGSRLIIAVMIGLLLQSFIDPEGAAWPKIAQDSMQVLMKGFTRRSVI